MSFVRYSKLDDKENSVSKVKAAADFSFEVDIEAGDLVLFDRPCTKMDVTSAAICMLAKTFAVTDWDHIGVVLEDANQQLFLLEANVKGITCRPLRDRLMKSNSSKFAIRKLTGRPKNEEFKRKLWDYSQTFVGKGYNSSAPTMIMAMLSTYYAHGINKQFQDYSVTRTKIQEIKKEMSNFKDLPVLYGLLSVSLQQLEARSESLALKLPKEATILPDNTDQIDEKDGYFCSELTASIYQNIGVQLPSRSSSSYFIPADYSSGTTTKGIWLSPEYYFSPELKVKKQDMTISSRPGVLTLSQKLPSNGEHLIRFVPGDVMSIGHQPTADEASHPEDNQGTRLPSQLHLKVLKGRLEVMTPHPNPGSQSHSHASSHTLPATIVNDVHGGHQSWMPAIAHEATSSPLDGKRVLISLVGGSPHSGEIAGDPHSHLDASPNAAFHTIHDDIQLRAVNHVTAIIRPVLTSPPSSSRHHQDQHHQQQHHHNGAISIRAEQLWALLRTSGVSYLHLSPYAQKREEYDLAGGAIRIVNFKKGDVIGGRRRGVIPGMSPQDCLHPHNIEYLVQGTVTSSKEASGEELSVTGADSPALLTGETLVGAPQTVLWTALSDGIVLEIDSYLASKYGLSYSSFIWEAVYDSLLQLREETTASQSPSWMISLPACERDRIRSKSFGISKELYMKALESTKVPIEIKQKAIQTLNLFSSSVNNNSSPGNPSTNSDSLDLASLLLFERFRYIVDHHTNQKTSRGDNYNYARDSIEPYLRQRCLWNDMAFKEKQMIIATSYNNNSSNVFARTLRNQDKQTGSVNSSAETMSGVTKLSLYPEIMLPFVLSRSRLPHSFHILPLSIVGLASAYLVFK